MGFYQAQLKDVIQYPDLKMEVFQIFREVGNAIIFCLLTEQAMVSSDIYCISQLPKINWFSYIQDPSILK